MPKRVNAAAPLPGTRWVRRNGKHAGTEIEVDHSTEISVFIKDVGEGNAMPSAKFDEARLNRVTLEQFRTHYVPKGQLAMNGTHGGKAFRRQYTPKRPSADELPEQRAPLQLNGYAIGSNDIGLSIEQVTPETAKAWLDRGGRNRKAIQRSIARFAASIRRGEWQLTGDSIKLDPEGKVIDGQNRLWAIVEAGTPITTLVARGVPSSAQDVIDTGRVRQANDVLSLHGFVNTMALASTIRALMLIENFGHYNIGGRQVALLITNASVLGYAQEHSEVAEGVRLAEQARKGGGLNGGTGLLGACMTMFWRLDQAAAEWFSAALASGANLDEDSPVLRLRNRLTGRDYGITQDNRGREMLLALVIKSWNAWRKGERTRALVWRQGTEPFPVAE